MASRGEDLCAPDGDYADGTVLTHVGSNNLWTAETWLAPKKDLTFAAVTNRGDDAAHETTAAVIGWLVRTYADD